MKIAHHLTLPVLFAILGSALTPVRAHADAGEFLRLLESPLGEFVLRTTPEGSEFAARVLGRPVATEQDLRELQRALSAPGRESVSREFESRMNRINDDLDLSHPGEVEDLLRVLAQRDLAFRTAADGSIEFLPLEQPHSLATNAAEFLAGDAPARQPLRQRITEFADHTVAGDLEQAYTNMRLIRQRSQGTAAHFIDVLEKASTTLDDLALESYWKGFADKPQLTELARKLEQKVFMFSRTYRRGEFPGATVRSLEEAIASLRHAYEVLDMGPFPFELQTR